MPIHRNFDTNYFKKWSRDMSYILGFLYADGNIVKSKRNTHFVAFYTSDYELLFNIRKLIRSDHKIAERRTKTGVVHVLQIGSIELFCDLVKLGLTPGKSRRMKLPDIPEKYRSDFIRGYFDGDGNVWSGYINKNRAKSTRVLNAAFTCASKDFLSELLLVVRALGVKGGSIYDIKNKSCSRLQFGTLDALKLYKIMYNKGYKLFLPRKKLVFESFMKMRP